MKQTFLLFLSLVLLASFVGRNSGPMKAKQIEKEFLPINNGMLLGKYEVSNQHYRMFLDQLQRTGQHDLFQQCMVDTTQLFRDADDDILKRYYYSHSTYDNYPVVAITHKAAGEYCKWLTNQYNTDTDRKFKKVFFRLPTEQEWTSAANAGNKNKMYPWDNYYLRDKNGRYLCNFRQIGDHAIYLDSVTKTYKVKEDIIGAANVFPLYAVSDFPPSPGGFYNLSGNVAEMVAESGLAKGGSYKDPGYDVTIGSKKYYQKPSSEIGFRILMEVLEK